jgi:hypothetical protein
VKVSELVSVSTNWSIATHKRVFWLGNLAWNGRWHASPYVNGTMIAAAVDKIQLKRTALEKLPECRINITCHHYSKNLTILDRMHSNRRSYNSGVEEATCAPTVIIPGFMKSATTYLFTALTAHPQILPPVKGSQMKETMCYHPQPLGKLVKRPWCYPYIEANESFVSTDGTVYYGTDQTVAQSIKDVSDKLI